ncbi:uncharacterized protein B0P05DRAFT_239820 [Gilbertella persicaria]|uniref:uncharacterized protein n=1 Tax=Gilbertella persicaria TaxID=101096 RepID=UPI00221FAFFA|nr:uncharacterized protein B0P05DRAFT_239820 [Gilbertella persicaria]KAI8063412.1 hypothetical protein B0P05DRAFT_239820 [Gilbertella persicaria]
MITASSHKTRCWYGSIRKQPLPYELMSGYSKNSTMRKRPRIEPDDLPHNDFILCDAKSPTHHLKRSSSDMTIYYDAQTEWDSLESQVESLFKSKFYDCPFVPNQLESMIAAIDGHDVFLVLPLGPLRHVCYQLPAVYQAQKTTVVIVPTLVFLQDYPLNTEAIFVSDIDKKGYVPLDQLEHRLFHDPPRLLYITHHDFRLSKQLMYDLYRRNRLARFVIEEAHCISPWWTTDDFSLHYSRLAQSLRETYVSLPITALTAIPNTRIQHDILTRLGMHDCRIFKKSILL